MVILFIVVVILTLTVSAMVSRFLYGQDVLERLQTDSLITGKQIVTYLTDNQIQDIDGYLQSSAVSNVYDYYVFPVPNGTSHTHELLTIDRINQVLNGGVYRSEIHLSNQDPDTVMIGLPFQINGNAYALFVKPNLSNMFVEFNKIANVFVFTTLLVGSLFILLAARYIIMPIRKITVATRKIAKGNYQVQVILNRYDELGELARSFNHMVLELQQIEKMRQDFVSDVSHEIQSPLTSIRGFSLALLNEDHQLEQRQHFLKIIVTESERLSKLTDNLLKLASLDSTQHPLHIEKFRLDEQLRHVIITMEPQWSAKSLDVELELQDAWIEADRDQLTQVWTNLLSNSIKFTPEGGLIRVRHHTEADFHEITLSDTGIGITDEEQSKVFHRFYKSDASRDRSHGGNGLGLAIVKKIIDLHSGSIQVQSQLAQGSSFVVQLPKEHVPS
jgi:signal transduction histidine kinase